MADDPPVADLPPLISLLETLELLLAQAQAYEAALSAREAGARLAIARLAELTQKALNEAHEVSIALSPKSTTTAPHTLSPRETEVLTLAAQGLTNKEIAYRLGLSERTVQFHMNGVFNKTSTNSRTAAVALALKNNWLKMGDDHNG